MARWRRLAALAAAGLAGVALVLFVTSSGSETAMGVTVPLAVMIGSALVVALWSSGQEWSSRRRVAAGLVALAWVPLSVPVLVSAIMVPGCACPASESGATFDLQSRSWVILSLLLGFICLVFAAALPARRRVPE